jgi:signal transduction histidine kinase
MALRWRVAVAATVLGALLSLGFAVALTKIAEDYEAILIAEILGSEAEDYSLALAANPQMALPRSHRLSGYLRRADGTGEVPTELAALGPGLYAEQPGQSADVTIGVYDIAQGRLYFVMDLGDIEALEVHLAWVGVAIILAGTALAAWLGWILAGASLLPVRELAAAVDALPVAPQPTQLGATMGDDELGHVARAIDGYQARLVEADAEERRFFADASHELRTPIAVVRGVSELLADDPAAPAAQRRWLERLDRGMAQLTLLLDVLLGLARGREWPLEPVVLDGLVADCIETLDLADPDALEVALAAPTAWPLPRHESRLVLQAVLRRLLAHGSRGRLAATASGDELELVFAPAIADAATPALGNQRGDGGGGSTLVSRLAAHLGWRVEYGDGPDGVRRARITREPVAPTPAVDDATAHDE